MPVVNYLLLWGGIVCLFIPAAEAGRLGIILGIFLIGIAAYRMVNHQSIRVNERYGMTIYTNSGIKKTLTSRDKNFIFDVMLTLSNVMNAEDLRAVNINLDTMHMSDQSINIGTNTGSPIVTGSIGQDLVNLVN